MSTMMKILKSDGREAEERQIARLKKEIEFLMEDLEIREERIRTKK